MEINSGKKFSSIPQKMVIGEILKVGWGSDLKQVFQFEVLMRVGNIHDIII